MRSVPRRSRGAAVVFALLTMALAAALATAVAWQVSHWLERLHLERDSGQSMQMTKAALDWIRSLLERDARESATDNLGEAWAQPTPIIPIEQDGELEGRIEDATGRFNLNNLIQDDGKVDARWLAAYRRLLNRLGLPVALAGPLADWMDRDTVSQADGAEDWGTARPANRPLLQVGEIAAIPGYTPEIVARLLPHVVALPGRAAVNANTAGREVLMALAEGGETAIPALLQQRITIPFKDRTDLMSRLTLAGIQMDGSLVDVSSNYFLVNGRLTYHAVTHRMQALILREGGTSRVVWWSDR